MHRFRNTTEDLTFIYILELDDLRLTLSKLLKIYKKFHPFSVKKDFILHIFGHVLSDLNEFILSEFTSVKILSNNDTIKFYYRFDPNTKRHLRFYALPSNKAINYYKQYFRRVIELIENVDFDSQKVNPSKQDSEVTFEFTNNFDTTNREDVYEHFHNGLVKSKMLTPLELHNYLKAAFELNQTPETLFQIKNAPTKNDVMSVFYLYYKDVSGKPYGKQKAYAGLLGNYFMGYNTDTISTNFSKTIY
ncbi:MAG: hypothetical protein ABJN95_10185 [Maribacter sp.]|uniref:hypothetical protein n=1 Tax=Maribacter sp. TaxID=1897614 RepID=UPI0032973121